MAHLRLLLSHSRRHTQPHRMLPLFHFSSDASSSSTPAAANQARLLRPEAAAAGPARGVRRHAGTRRWTRGPIPATTTAAAADAAAGVDAAGYAVREGRGARNLARLVPIPGCAAARGPPGRRGGGGGAGGAEGGGGADPDERGVGHEEHLRDADRGGAAAVPDDHTRRQEATEGRH
ncbi:hypothetical protein BS78_K185600 [Paspalum vaginatum]|uniref:Uncharacterized protein n=1 Tax=Paspalum vaginatum TaxID=158149 RepID=A0A9W8CFC2_9POAL|nr:hypothetical protein BS78_K185600 [Paspalum vaginatum]